MKKNIKKKTIQILCFLIILTSSVVLAAAQTDAEIQNYSKENITIEYRLVTIGGDVKWKPIGKIPKGTARLVRNLTIGSVIRAKGDRVSQEFTIGSPPPGKNQVVISVR